jgi:adenylate kinase family enzyme
MKMKRICVIGTSGSGKTTVARELAARLGLTYIDNDAIIWRARWTPTPKADVYAEMEAATRGDRWVFDGNLGPDASDALVVARCDALVWLDLPRWRVHGQILRRSVRRAWTGEPQAHGNRETWRTLLGRNSIVLWSIRTYARRKRQYGAMFADPAFADRRRVRLRSRREVDAFLGDVVHRERE